MKIMIINGPNLNLLGKREPSIYGSEDFQGFFERLRKSFPDHSIAYFQSNIEGELVDQIQKSDDDYDAIILNAAAYTHTSIAISDAIAAIRIPVIEVHISNIYAREEFRHKSIISKNCIGMISGLGLEGYMLALSYLIHDEKE